MGLVWKSQEWEAYGQALEIQEISAYLEILVQ